MGELPHAAVQGFFTRRIGNHAAEWQVRVYPELRVHTSAARFRIPDVCVLRDTAPFEQIVRTPPLLCIEILSWNDRMTG